jgi:hypothetical protein
MDILTLNVGGEIYTTTLSTLSSKIHTQETLFSIMFKEKYDKMVSRDLNGNIFIDRDGKHFGIILNYLRNNGDETKTAFPFQNSFIIDQLISEAEYFQLHHLKEFLTTRGIVFNKEMKAKVLNSKGFLVTTKPQIKHIEFLSEEAAKKLYYWELLFTTTSSIPEGLLIGVYPEYKDLSLVNWSSSSYLKSLKDCFVYKTNSNTNKCGVYVDTKRSTVNFYEEDIFKESVHVSFLNRSYGDEMFSCNGEWFQSVKWGYFGVTWSSPDKIQFELNLNSKHPDLVVEID